MRDPLMGTRPGSAALKSGATTGLFRDPSSRRLGPVWLLLRATTFQHRRAGMAVGRWPSQYVAAASYCHVLRRAAKSDPTRGEHPMKFISTRKLRAALL